MKDNCKLPGICELHDLIIVRSCPGPLFITSNRTYVMRQFFYSMLSTLLIRIGLSQKHFNTHSFRIGAATSAKAAIYISKHWKQCVPSIYQDSTYRDSSIFKKNYRPASSLTIASALPSHTRQFLTNQA